MEMIKHDGISRRKATSQPAFVSHTSGPVRRAAISFADPAKEVTRGLILESEYKRGVAVRAVRDLVLLLPILAAPSPRHRADIPVQLADMASGGFSGLQLCIRAGYPRLARIKDQTFLGRLTDATLARVNAALKREAEAQAFEDTPSIASTFAYSDWSEGDWLPAGGESAAQQISNAAEGGLSEMDLYPVANAWFPGRRQFKFTGR